MQVRALAYTHFCNNWFHYTMLAWLPTYFTDTLDLNLSQAAQVRLHRLHRIFRVSKPSYRVSSGSTRSPWTY